MIPLLEPTKLGNLLDGRQRGVRAGVLRSLLWAGKLPYAVAVNWRNRRFDRGHGVQRVPVPVVSVGNITAGGTGKTPMVAWLARWFRNRGVRVTLISRGYGAQAGSQSDEASELERLLPDVPHLQNPDRCQAARTAIEELDTQLILLDDAFQHRRIQRDIDLVLIDALEPFGYGHLIPRGTLREPLRGLERATVIGITRSDCVSEQRLKSIRTTIGRHAPAAPVLELAHCPQAFRTCSGSEVPLTLLADQPVAAFCGIGNPRGFQRTLSQCNLRLAAMREFPDHHPYGRDDIHALAAWAAELDVAAAVCTEKDLVKIRLPRLGALPLYSVRVQMQIQSNQPALEQLLEELLAQFGLS